MPEPDGITETFGRLANHFRMLSRIWHRPAGCQSSDQASIGGIPFGLMAGGASNFWPYQLVKEYPFAAPAGKTTSDDERIGSWRLQ